MDLHDLSDMGNQIKDVVNEAFETKDFRHLSRNISQTVNETMDRIDRESGNGFYYQPRDDRGNPIYGSGTQGAQGSSQWTATGSAGQTSGQTAGNTYGTGPQNTYGTGSQNTYGTGSQNTYGTGSQNTYGTGPQNTRSRGAQKSYSSDKRSAAGSKSGFSGGAHGAYNGGPRRTSERAWRASSGSSGTSARTGAGQTSGGNTQNYQNQGAAYSPTVRRSGDVYDVGFPVLKNPPGRVSSVLLMFFGYAFSAIFAILEIILILNAIIVAGGRGAFLATAAGFLPALIASVIVSFCGTSMHQRLNRFKSYLRVLKGKTFASFKELSSRIGKKPEFVRKDVSHMIDKGYFPEGHIDEQGTCLMVTDQIYQQYLETQANAKALQEAAAAKAAAEEAQTTPEQRAQLRKIEEEGKRYMQHIREANDAIPDTEISNKLYRMEAIVQKIFEYARQNPDQISQLRRFMDYYMPTTDKLVTAYKEFDAQQIQGENIKNAKEEIAKSLDMINDAYEKLYDGMYMEARMDVSSDIAVLQAMLAQEGLTESDFKKK